MSPSQQEQTETRLSLPQYEMLKRCSAAKDLTEWNEWRRQNPGEEILLEKADLSYAYLQDANLSMAQLHGAGLTGAHLQRADLNLAEMGSSHLSLAHLDGAGLSGANLSGADLTGTDLHNAYLLSSNLQDTMFRESHLHHATFFGANLAGANFAASIVDGGTYIWDCAIDRKTDFLGVGLDGARVEPGLKQLLEYNVRRLRWSRWYRKHPIIHHPVQLFWLMSNYRS